MVKYCIRTKKKSRKWKGNVRHFVNNLLVLDGDLMIYMIIIVNTVELP